MAGAWNNSASGTLGQPAKIAWSVPADAIEGSVKANVKFYPSTFSQLVEGLEAISSGRTAVSSRPPRRRIRTCWHWTTSAAPRRACPRSRPARQYIHLGYQRLLGFEIAGGGFDWFGCPPANRTLTAYGLMEFQGHGQDSTTSIPT